MQTVECPNALDKRGDHLWFPCFGTCQCNKAYCNLCGASRDLTADEWERKHASSDAGSRS
jgi:hypothetical protein